jgi:ribosome maturation factor RimP
MPEKTHSAIVNQLQELVEPLVTASGFSQAEVFYHKEPEGWYVTVIIDKDGGVSINDCAILSRTLSKLLDQRDFIKESYFLEVSSKEHPQEGEPK